MSGSLLKQADHRLTAGLTEVDDQVGKLSSHVLDRRLVQVVLSRESSLIGKTVRETRFRSRFDAAIVAIHREGARQRQKIGDIQLAVHSVNPRSLQCVMGDHSRPALPSSNAPSFNGGGALH
jgi:di/tricarboxylate transporter